MKSSKNAKTAEPVKPAKPANLAKTSLRPGEKPIKTRGEAQAKVRELIAQALQADCFGVAVARVQDGTVHWDFVHFLLSDADREGLARQVSGRRPRP